MLQTRPIKSHRVDLSMLGRLRYQLLTGWLLAVALPTTIRALFEREAPLLVEPWLLGTNYENSIITCLIAVTIGTVLFRQFAKFPGVRTYEWVMPSFAISYGIVLAGLLILRLDYVVTIMVGSFFIATINLYVVSFLVQRSSMYSFFVVPIGDVARVHQITDAKWIFLREPELPPVKTSGIVVDLRADMAEPWERLLADSTLAGIPVFHVKHLCESITGQVEVEHISENSFGVLNPSGGYAKFKYVGDMVVALAALPLVLPLFAVIAIAIAIDSPGGVFYRQHRLGYRGIPFRVLKFRTMRALSDAGDDMRASAMTADGDSRVTRVGRFLRRTRLDELPQIYNILRGEMSWVGPRPEAMALSQWYQQQLAFYSYRHIVKPGITGWAQVNQGHVADVEDVHYKLCYDFYYIKFQSAWLDMLILFRTIRTVLTGTGAK